MSEETSATNPSSPDEPEATSAGSSSSTDRRTFLSRTSSVAMLGGLGASYGTFAALSGRFLYPASSGDITWLFVTDLKSFAVGDAMEYRIPGGGSVNIARVASEGTVEDFLALSSICPHLGCRVHWEGPKRRFFCPCHNGVFDPTGRPVSGPPADADQELSRYELKVEGPLLFLGVTTATLAAGDTKDKDPDSSRVASSMHQRVPQQQGHSSETRRTSKERPA